MKGLMYGFWGWGVVLVATVITTQVQAQNCAPTLSVFQGFSPVIEISGSIGAPLTIRCSVDPAPPTTPVSTYVWQKNGMDIVVPDITLQQFTFPSLQVSEGGRYRCGVQLDTISCSGEMIYSPEITINTPPEISALTGPTTVTEGDTLQLTCTAIGWPPPTIEWFHPNGSLLVTDEVFTNPSFISGDEGNYTCQASNSRGMVTQSITITVEVPPPVPTSVIPSPTQTMTSPSPTPTATPAPEVPPAVISVDGPTSLREGDTLRLNCVASGSPPPTIQWFHPNGSLVGTDAIYTDPSFSQSDEGNYTCVANNSRGSSTQTFTVRLEESSNVGLIVLLVVCSALAAILISFTFIMLGFCCSEIRKRDSLKRLRSTSTADELQLIEEAVDEGAEGDGSPESLAKTSSCNNKAFIEDESGEEVKPGPVAQKEEDREALYKMDPQQHARHVTSHVTSSGSKGRGKSDSKAKKPKQTKAGAVPYNILVEDPRFKEQRPSRKQTGSSSGSHGAVVFDPRLSHQQQQQILMQRQQKQQMKALQHQQRAQPSRASMPPEVLLAHERERRVGKPGAATRERKGSKQRDPRERMSAPVGAVPSQVKKGSQHKAASEKAPAPVPVAPTGAGQKQKGKKKKNEKTEQPVSPRSQPEGEEDRQTKEPTPEKVQMKEVETVAQHMPISAAQASEPTVTTFKTREQDRHGDGDHEEEEEENAIRTTAIVISERTGETVVAMEQEAPDLTELSEGEEEGLEPSGSEEEEEEVGGASGGKEGDKQRLLPAKEEEVEEDPNVTRMSVFIEKAKKMGRPVSIIQQLDRSHPLNLAQVQEMLDNEASQHSLTVEYNSVPHNAIQTLQQPLAESQKNRYRNVLPNPHSSVKLHSTGEDGSTYINANFIRGYSGKENTYIATQGPFVSTIPDFWRMVWEQNISIIVMITGLVERSKHKCAKYWPEADSPAPATYGEMVVRNNFEETSAAYKVSYLSVYPKDQDEDAVEERDVYHFWYTAWPDFGVPSESAPSLRLREAVSSFQNPDSGPILVHCSAGLGRTGTFMAIDMGVQQYEQEGVVDPLKYMCEMRQDRGGTIQTAEQYVFIHRALADYMASKPK